MVTVPLPRGIRNNNPGNLRWGDPWLGLVAQKDRTDRDFCQFQTPEYGLRAMAVVLRNYQLKHKLMTVNEIVRRWAPPSENNTGAYIKSVAAALKVFPHDKVDLSNAATMTALVKAIIQHENGQMPYTDAQLKGGVTAAGLYSSGDAAWAA